MYKVVLADDEQMIRRGLESLPWAEHGMKVVAVAKDGIEAQEIIDSMEFDLLITDIKMPGITGVELAKSLHQTNADTRTILLSGYGEFTYARQALGINVFDYILKPSTPAEIMRCAEAACRALEAERAKSSEMQRLQKKVEDYQKVVGPEKEIDKKNGNQIEDILKYIYQHYDQPLTLAVLAEHFHFSTVYLSMYIKRFTGHTFLEILTSVRMYYAAKYLRETRMKNAEIGACVGVPDERYFGQVFKKSYGMTPYEFRKSNQEIKFSLEDLFLKEE